jgi:hypothetical protein
VTVLLDENFPLGLVRALRADGVQVDHIITLNFRGAPDRRIRELLSDRDIVFLTQDDDFLVGSPVDATVVVSRVRQSRPLADRIEVWRKAITSLDSMSQATRVFQLSDEGMLEPWLGERRR